MKWSLICKKKKCIPYTKGCFVPSFHQCIFAISILFEKGVSLHLNLNLTSLYLLYYVLCHVKIGIVVLEKMLRMWKVYRHTDRWTTADQISSLKLSTPVSYKVLQWWTRLLAATSAYSVADDNKCKVTISLVKMFAARR